MRSKISPINPPTSSSRWTWMSFVISWWIVLRRRLRVLRIRISWREISVVSFRMRLLVRRAPTTPNVRNPSLRSLWPSRTKRTSSSVFRLWFRVICWRAIMPTTVRSVRRRSMPWRGCASKNFPITWLSYSSGSISISIWWRKPKSMISVSSHLSWICSSTLSRVWGWPRTSHRVMNPTPTNTSSISWVASWFTKVQLILGTTIHSFRSVRRTSPRIKGGTSSMISLSLISTRRISSQRGMVVKSKSTVKVRWCSRINLRMPIFCSTRESRS